MNPDIAAEIKLCENDIKWLKERIEILKELDRQGTKTAKQKADKLIKELQ